MSTDEGFRSLEEGQLVEVELVKEQKGRQAQDVVKLSQSELKAPQHHGSRRRGDYL